jgi:uncharacterized protein (TIGR00299 family) protein
MRNAISGTEVTIDVSEQTKKRNLRDILAIVDDSRLSDAAKSKCRAIFTDLARVEAAIHNKTLDKIHFHEVGAVDSILDIAGAVAGLELLDIQRITASKIHVGTGFIQCRHGTLPVPAPATAALLKGLPVYSTGIEAELVTPTGAVLVKNLSESFGSLPPMRVSAVGYGAGSLRHSIPNLLRVFLGHTEDSEYFHDTSTIIQANIDDMNPELFEHVFQQLFQAGAADVYTFPIQMKNNRTGVQLNVLVQPDAMEGCLEAIFKETTTLGVRIQEVGRWKLDREMLQVDTPYGPIQVKLGKARGRVFNIAPEYRSCKAAADRHKTPLKAVYDAARQAAGKALSIN